MNVNPFSYLIEKLKSKVSKSGDTMSGQLNIDQRNGTISDVGYSVLALGNSIASGTANNSTGIVDLYSDSGNKVRLYTVENVSGTKYVKLPNASGTVALTSDLGGVSHEIKKSDASGVLTYQLSLNTIHVMEFSNATYHVLVSGGFAYHSDKKIGGDTLTLSYDEGTGILTVSGARAITNAHIAKWSIG